jgi:superkiller protein 3
VYKGNIFFNLKKYDKAFSVLKETRKIDNKCIGCLLNMALTTAKQGKLNQSLQYLRIILKINPKEKDARENLVRGLIKLDRKKEAIKNIDYLIKFFGGNTTYYEIKGELLLDLKQYKKALKCFNMSIKKDKNHICPYINKVIIFKNLGDYKSASYSMKIAKRVFSKNKKTASKGTEKEIKKLEKLINKKDVENE